MKLLESRLAAIEKRLAAKDEIYCLFVEPPEGVVIDNRTVFKTEADIPPGYLKQVGEVAIFKGLDPEKII